MADKVNLIADAAPEFRENYIFAAAIGVMATLVKEAVVDVKDPDFWDTFRRGTENVAKQIDDAIRDYMSVNQIRGPIDRREFLDKFDRK